MADGLPSVFLADFIPFVIIGLVVLLFSILFIRRYEHRHVKHLSTTVISSIGLAVAVITCALIPADIFLASFMKNSNGTFKSWANGTAVRESLENGVLYTYYVLYSCVLLFLFVIFPLMYFYHEEDEDTRCAAKCGQAFRNSLFFLVLLLVFFIIGAFAPFAVNPQQNATDVRAMYFTNVFDHNGASRVEATFSFVLSLVSLFGMFTLVLYMGVGAGIYPVDLIKGRRMISREYADLLSQRISICGQIQEYRQKAENAQLSSQEHDRLDAMQDDVELINRRLQQLEVIETSLLTRCLYLTRPIQIAIGIFFVLVIFLVMFSLLMANIDRFMNSHGIKSGYLLVKYELPIIIDIIFVFLQKVYPLDYVFMFLVVAVLFICAVGGINTIGIWFLWIRMYKVHAHKMMPQALLMFSFLLNYVALAVPIIIHQIAPQYVTYGSQHYITKNITFLIDTGDHKVISCSTEAPPGECIMTTVASILFRFYYRLWFFGAVYFWLSWLFLLVFIISFIVAVVRKRLSPIEGVEYSDLLEEEQPLLRNV